MNNKFKKYMENVEKISGSPIKKSVAINYDDLTNRPWNNNKWSWNDDELNEELDQYDGDGNIIWEIENINGKKINNIMKTVSEIIKEDHFYVFFID